MIPIDISFTRAFCSRHGEPFRADWPTGYAAATVSLAEFVIPQLQPKGELDLEASPELIEVLLDVVPLCCRAPRGVLFHAYLDAKIGRRATCQVCRRVRWGAPYETTRKTYRHLCFHCVVWAETRVPTDPA